MSKRNSIKSALKFIAFIVKSIQQWIRGHRR